MLMQNMWNAMIHVALEGATFQFTCFICNGGGCFEFYIFVLSAQRFHVSGDSCNGSSHFEVFPEHIDLYALIHVLLG